MKIIILEGIATSGKSTVINGIKARLQDYDVRIADEDETHIPIMKLPNELHISFFEDLIKDCIAGNPELVIFDRLYLTQAFRANVGLTEYSEVEKLLSQYDTLTVFLKVDEATIADRVAKAVAHRDSSWGEYVQTKGATDSEIAHYYIVQQRNQLRLLATSKLAHMVCDTTEYKYEAGTQQILDKLRIEYI